MIVESQIVNKKSVFIGKWIRVVFFIFLAISPFVVDDPVLFHMMIVTCLFAMMGMGWNLIGGYTGQFSLGHCAFFGLGAYTSSILYMKYGLSPWIGMFLGALVAALVASTIGFVCLRLRGPFFSLATLAVAEVIRIVCVYFKDITAGSVGLLIPFRPSLLNFIFREKYIYFWIILVFAIITYYIVKIIINRSLGYYLIAIREDEDAAKMLGINTMRCKVISLAISAAITAIGGTFYAQYVSYISPETMFSFDISIQLAFVSIIGGVGTLLGPIVGALFIIPLNEFLRATLGKYQSLYLVFYGITMIIIVILVPGGLLKWLRVFIERIFMKTKRILYNN